MEILVGACFFAGFFGITWAICIRCSDWGTERWNRGTHWMKVCGGGLAWLAGFGWLGTLLAGKTCHATTAQALGAAAGILAAVLGYVMRWQQSK